eukprot:CCRYP_016828-RA/>CCRYP_016828-RA protein AED:0.02 eAED:0.02 QI:0/0/0/1/0/0.5/2/0/461
MQCRLNGIKISELPKFLAEDPDESTHSLQVVDPLDDSSPLFIPLSLTGVTSYFQVRKPTIAEWENEAAYPHIDLTAEEPIWDPQSSDFSEMEDRMIDFRGQVMCRTSTARGRMVINSLSVSLQVSAVDVTDDENFGLLLESKACVSSSISKHKSDAHEALSLLFQRDRVPPACIVDGSLEQVKGEFRRKLKEASCRLKQTEPYSPWQNAAEGNIRELKKGAGRKMIKSGSPKKLWDDCLVLESYIRSNTAHDIYMPHGEVPETIMSGETSDLSQFCEFEWYEWVKFRDSAVRSPEDSLVLGRYLGPSIDVGPALTGKILKQNGEVVHRSTYRGLTPEEIVNPVDQAAMKSFNESIEVKFGPKASIDDFKDLGIDEPPILDRYEDDDLDGRTPDPPDEELDATPEVGDSYVNTEVMLSRGDRMARGKVVRRKRNAKGNPIGRANNNPILDTSQYEVQFADGE